MAIQIQLHDAHPFYTNLDYIGGQVILSLSSDEKISNIFVKLEGESRTTLVRPRDYIGAEGGRHRYRATEATENHKVLYKVVHVFPTEEGPGVGTKGQAYTLRAGKHEYPFRFKIPFNNGCSDPRAQGIGPGTGFGGFGVGGLLQMENQHVKRTLPPSLTGFPGVAEIRYYVKVTIQRPSLFKENRRESVEFQFLPIEPPKAAPSVKNVFAKSLYEFKPLSSSTDVGSSKNAASVSNTLPKGEAEARLLGPAVITCNEPIPLQLIIKNLNDSPQQLFLISFELHLIGTTIMKAVDIVHSEKTSWAIITSKSLAIPVGNPLDAIQTETVVDKKLWESMPLPSTVVPSFYTCNIRRRYELEVQLGLGYGTLGNIQVITLSHLLNTNLTYTRPKPSRCPSVSKSRSTLASLRLVRFSMLWQPAVQLDRTKSRVLCMILRTLHSLPQHPCPKSMRCPPTRMLWPTTSVRSRACVGTTLAAQTLTNHQWARTHLSILATLRDRNRCRGAFPVLGEGVQSFDHLRGIHIVREMIGLGTHHTPIMTQAMNIYFEERRSTITVNKALFLI